MDDEIIMANPIKQFLIALVKLPIFLILLILSPFIIPVIWGLDNFIDSGCPSLDTYIEYYYKGLFRIWKTK